MLLRAVPSTGESLPAIGLGTWQVFDVNGGARELAPLKEVLQRLFAAGGRVVDSSPMYGRAEAVTGTLLAEMNARRESFLATKVWIHGAAAGAEQMRRSAELLRSPVIDLMQIHNLVDWRSHLATLRQMKAEGRLRYIGITHYTTGAMAELAQIIERERDIAFVQACYSLGTRAAETRLLPVCAERGVAFLANRPFEEGALFRRMRGRDLPAWAAEFGCASWAQFFLKYILAETALTCVIPATADPAHMADNLAAGTGPLPDAKQRQAMRDFWDGG